MAQRLRYHCPVPRCPVNRSRRSQVRSLRCVRHAMFLGAMRGRCAHAQHYLSDVLIDVNLFFRLVPSPLTIAMIARAMPAAINPYSMAVAPLSSAKNFCTVFMS
jgi:hypothetical protein